jgi:ribosomal protein L34
LGKLQEEVSKTPQTVKIDVQVSNGQRRVTTFQFHSETGPMKKARGKPSGYRKRSATKNCSSTTGKKAKVVQEKKYSK